MSRVSDAKKKQNYQDRPVRRKCSNCKFVSTRGDFDLKYTCELGNFAVKANAVCDRFEIGGCK